MRTAPAGRWRARRAAARLLGLLAWAAPLPGAEQLPTPPKDYFNDYAKLLPPADAQRLNEKLRRFDQESSNQVVVAVFPELPSASMEDFAIRTAESWKAGRPKLDNGVVLFVFPKERKLRLEVGYGLEGALPDITAKQIVADRIAPAFREGRYAEGLEAGIDAIIAATRGEYKATPARPAGPSNEWGFLLLLFVMVMFVLFSNRGRRSRTYGHRGYYGGGPWYGGGWGGGGGWGQSGGGWGGGGGFSGGGGGFSGGGGSFGGGGASGDW